MLTQVLQKLRRGIAVSEMLWMAAFAVWVPHLFLATYLSQLAHYNNLLETASLCAIIGSLAKHGLASFLDQRPIPASAE